MRKNKYISNIKKLKTNIYNNYFKKKVKIKRFEFNVKKSRTFT